MNRKVLAAGLIAIAVFSVSSCSEDGTCDLQCPPYDDDGTQTLRILVLSALSHPTILDSIPGSFDDTGLLPEGSVVDLFEVVDSERALHIPEPEFLQQYDVVTILTETWPADMNEYERYDTIGDLLADYVDGGGGLVMFQYAMYAGSARIQGRICTPGYSPLRTTNYLDTENWDDRHIVLDSLNFPLHPIFNGIDIDELLLPGSFLADPELDESAVLLASDDRSTNVIAINASGSIVGYNVSVEIFAFPRFEEAVKLGANAILYVAD